MHENKLYCNQCTKLIIPSDGYYHDSHHYTLCWNCFTAEPRDFLALQHLVPPLDNDEAVDIRFEPDPDADLELDEKTLDARAGLMSMLESYMQPNQRHAVKNDHKRKKSTPMFDIPSPKEVYDHLNKYVIGQDDAKKALSVMVSNHRAISQFNLDHPDSQIKKSNLLIIGPSGTGKTLMIEKVADYLQVPYVSVSATEYTEAGYVGKDVEQMISLLIESAGGDKELAETGVIFIDEVDKIIAAKSHSTRDVSGSGVQHALLRMIEGGIMHIPAPQNKYAPNSKELMEFDTSNVLFVFGGAFTALRESKAGKKAAIGFSSNGVEDNQTITSEDLIKAGMIREFVGRVQHIVSTTPLSDDDLLRVLTEPADSIISQHENLLAYKNIGNVNLRDSEFLKSLIAEAKVLGTGARGLKVALERRLLDKYFEG